LVSDEPISSAFLFSFVYLCLLCFGCVIFSAHHKVYFSDILKYALTPSLILFILLVIINNVVCKKKVQMVSKEKVSENGFKNILVQVDDRGQVVDYGKALWKDRRYKIAGLTTIDTIAYLLYPYSAKITRPIRQKFNDVRVAIDLTYTFVLGEDKELDIQELYNFCLKHGVTLDVFITNFVEREARRLSQECRDIIIRHHQDIAPIEMLDEIDQKLVCMNLPFKFEKATVSLGQPETSVCKEC
jgi:hypothetical protein